MKKATTKYYEIIELWYNEAESIDIIINEESTNKKLIKVEFYQEQWRTKEEYKQLFIKLAEMIDRIP